MNKAIALFIFTVTASFGYAGNTGGGVHKPTPKSNDSIAITTSNIAIFFNPIIQSKIYFR